MIAVAFDDAADEVRPWTEGITFPVLIDRNHLLTELYAISNVPTVIWIDEDDRIVRPNGVAFGTDMFKFLLSSDLMPLRTSVRSPWRNGVAERWVGSVRRELLDQVIPLNEFHLRRLGREP